MKKSFWTKLWTAALIGTMAWTAQAEDNKVVIDGSTTVGPIVKAFAQHFKKVAPDLNITISESGSGNGAKSLINEACDIASMSRFMKEGEFKAAVEKGVMPVAHVIAFDGLVIAVHPSNPIKGVTIEQVKDIYLGKIKSWKELGGPDVPIVPISRDTSSGTFETFEGLVMNKERIAQEVEMVGSNGAVRQRVQSTPGAIGYVGLGFVDKTLKPLTVNKIKATQATIASGHYPIARPLYLFTNKYPKLGSSVFTFVTFYLTKEGQNIVLDEGFVPLTNYPDEEEKEDK